MVLGLLVAGLTVALMFLGEAVARFLTAEG
jgi:hypothetical protein